MIIQMGAAAARLAGWTVDYSEVGSPRVYNAVGKLVWVGIERSTHKDDETILNAAWQAVYGWKRQA